MPINSTIMLLAIDEKPDNLTTLSAMLRDALPQATLLTATSGLTGIELAIAKDPDVILLDIDIPGRESFKLCRLLKADERLKDIPVVFLTTRETESTNRVRALKAGAQGFLAKPLEPFELTAQIRTMVKVKAANRSQRMEKEQLEALVAEKTLELRESEEQYRLMIEHQQDLVVKTDPEGRLIFVNQAYCELFNKSKQELLGTTYMPLVHPDDLPAVEKAVALLFKPPYKCEYEERALSNHGWRWLSWTARANFNEKGEIIELLGTGRDITERKKAEEEIARLAMEWQSTFDSVNDSIWLLDADSRIIRTNRMAEKTFGRPAKEIIGKHCWEIGHGMQEPFYECPILRMRKILQRETMELPIEDRCFEVTVDPILDGNGNFAGAVHIVSDITERKRTEKALNEGEKRYRTLFEQSYDAMMTLAPPSWRFTTANPAALSLFEMKSLDQFLELRPWDVSPKRQPDGGLSSDKALEMIEIAMSQGSHFFEWTHRSLNGRIVPCSVLLSKMEMSGQVFLQATMRNITLRKRAEEALQESHEILSLFIKHSPIYAYLKEVTPTESLVLWASDNFQEMIGIPGSQMVGKKMDELFLPEFARKISQDDWDVVSKGEVLRIDEELNNRKYKTIKFPIATGRKKLLAGYTIDITEIKRVEEELRESEAMFRALFNEHAAIKLLIDPQDGRIVDANKAAVAFYGWPREQLLNMKILEINTLPPEDIKKNMEEVRSEKRGYFEFQHRCADGTIRDVAVLSSKIDVKGRVLLHSIVQDISERKRAEAEIHRLQTAIEQSGDTVVVTSRTGTIQYVNAAFEQLTGYSRDEVLGLTPSLLKSGEQDEGFYRDLWATITSGRTWRGRMVNRRKDGDIYTEESTISPIYDSAGEITNFMAVKRDITDKLRIIREKELLEVQLTQSQKLESVGRLAGGVAHDFNNMLGVILGYGEIVLKKLLYGDPLRADVEQIVKAGNRSAGLIRQLLAFSRKQTLQPEVLNLNDQLHHLEKMLRRLISEDIDIKMALADDLASVLIDPVQFDQIIINIAVNARDAMPTGGKLIIETENVGIDELYAKIHQGVLPGEYVLISLTDSGCGMDKKILAQIFEPFFTTKEKGKGTGMGLATVYGIVKQSGGNIWAYSEPGQGTTFKIYLPQTHAKPQEQKTALKTEEHVIGNGRSVLVVEDDEALRELLLTILTMLGFGVFIAANGGEALLLTEEQGLKPDLLITDVVMPGMSGALLVERLRRNQPELKVLFMSGYTENAIVHHGVLEPGIPFIQKPFSFQRISDTIRKVLQSE